MTITTLKLNKEELKDTQTKLLNGHKVGYLDHITVSTFNNTKASASHKGLDGHYYKINLDVKNEILLDDVGNLAGKIYKGN